MHVAVQGHTKTREELIIIKYVIVYVHILDHVQLLISMESHMAV